MDNTDKLRVLLKHWIEHNGGHVEEFDKWCKLMTDEGNSEISSLLESAKDQMDKVSDILGQALTQLGGEMDGDHHHHHHHHH